MAMTVADRIDPVFRRWVTPVVVADGEAYVGRHRRTGRALMSLLSLVSLVSLPRMFYTARHHLR
jgi:hypothetical protein